MIRQLVCCAMTWNTAKYGTNRYTYTRFDIAKSNQNINHENFPFCASEWCRLIDSNYSYNTRCSLGVNHLILHYEFLLFIETTNAAYIINSHVINTKVSNAIPMVLTKIYKCRIRKYCSRHSSRQVNNSKERKRLVMQG